MSINFLLLFFFRLKSQKLSMKQSFLVIKFLRKFCLYRRNKIFPVFLFYISFSFLSNTKSRFVFCLPEERPRRMNSCVNCFHSIHRSISKLASWNILIFSFVILISLWWICVKCIMCLFM
jgi:hypothetical protein